MRVRAAIASFTLATSVATFAVARDPVAAEALFRAGRDAMKRNDFATACARFKESQTLDPAGGTSLNLAQCEGAQGRVASAWMRLREAIDLLDATDDRVPLARQKLAELEARVPHLTISIAGRAPPGTKVARDDVEVTGALLAFPQPVDPGAHVVRVTAPGRRARDYRVSLAEAGAETLAVEAGEPLPAPSLVVRVDARRRTAGLIVGGVGIAAIGAGLVAGLVVVNKASEKDKLCPGNVCPDASARDSARTVDSQGKTYSVVSTAGFGVGIAAVAVGGLLILTSRHEERAPAVTPVVSREGGGIAWSGTF